ncbi:hypothetical protein XAC9322_700065 [Xanthomonas citri pv. citri]|nr:hypothetical protein XAC9322_700065 [Xanthomonas citri pv. citri]
MRRARRCRPTRWPEGRCHSPHPPFGHLLPSHGRRAGGHSSGSGCWRHARPTSERMFEGFETDAQKHYGPPIFPSPASGRLPIFPSPASGRRWRPAPDEGACRIGIANEGPVAESP